MRLSRVSKLAGALLIGASLLLVGVWQQALNYLAVGGNTYIEIADAKDLVADVLPPPQYVIEPFLLATLALRDPVNAPMLQVQSIQLKGQYDERHNYWIRSRIDGQVRNLLLAEAHPPAAAFWVALLDDFYPALLAGDISRADKAYGAMSMDYARHRTAIDKVVMRATTLVLLAEANSDLQRRNVTLITAVFSIMTLALVCGCVWALCTHYSGPIERLQNVMDELSSGRLDVDVPFASRADEIGGMARSILVFREEGQRKTVLSRQNETLNAQLSERTSALEQTLNNIAQGIVLMRDGKPVLCNENALSLLEVSSEADVCAKLEVANAGSNGATGCDERRVLPADQSRRDLTCISGRVVEIRHNKGSQIGEVYTISDVTALKRRQAELEAALTAAASAMESRTRFFSTMSHEMRTPLNGVIGSLELLRGQVLNEEQNELVAVGIQSCDALLAQISDVLDFSKMEAGKLELNPVPTVIADLVKSAIAVMTPLANHRLTKLQTEFKGSLPVAILADGARVRQVILNFMSNALKFTRQGTVTVRVRCTGGTSESPELEFAVMDTGAGIPKERLCLLFNEFAMVHAATIETSGTGLGLAISKRLVAAMGGSVGVESVEGLGSVFWFRIALPVVEPIAPIGPAATGTAEDCRNLKVLLVDDNRTNRLVGSRLLTRDGHHVETANNGREAVEAAARGGYDVIFMDVSMPEMDGIEATRQIRQLSEPQRSVHVIALTANAVRGDRERFLAAGMDDYLSKPLRPIEIQERLRAIGSTSAQFEFTGAAAAASGEPPVLDMSMLEALSAGDSDILAEILGTFCGELDGRLCELQAAIKEASGEKLKAVAHAIAGASASTGAALLAARSRQAERDYLEGNLEAALRIAHGLPVLVRRTQEACRIRIGAAISQSSVNTIAA